MKNQMTTISLAQGMAVAKRVIVHSKHEYHCVYMLFFCSKNMSSKRTRHLNFQKPTRP